MADQLPVQFRTAVPATARALRAPRRVAPAVGWVGAFAGGSCLLAGPAMAASFTTGEPGAAPFGALSLGLLVGALGIGAGLGAAAATALRGHSPAVPLPRGTPDARTIAVPRPQAAEPSDDRDVPDDTAGTVNAGHGEIHADLRHAEASNVASDLGDAPLLASFLDETLPVENWLESVADGPRFGPRIVGVVTIRGGDLPAALADLAHVARTDGRDVILVDAVEDTDALADALDDRMPQRQRTADHFGAAARVEVVPLPALLADGGDRSASRWRSGLDALAARTDVLLVGLPDVGQWDTASGILSVLDEAVLAHEVGADAAAISAVTEAADGCGIDLTGRIIVPAPWADRRAASAMRTRRHA